MIERSLNHSTDTHMAKKYNDVLFDCMQRCNLACFATEGSPHFQSLLSYYAAVNTFFNNTFMMFESIKIDGDVSLSELLNKQMLEVKSLINEMTNDQSKQTTKQFQIIARECNEIHKMIILGLQRRNMLVRESESEPKGRQVINYWKEKKNFAKGDLP